MVCAIVDGPVWLGKLNDQAYVARLQGILDDEKGGLPLATKKKINGVLHGILTESPLPTSEISLFWTCAM